MYKQDLIQKLETLKPIAHEDPKRALILLNKILQISSSKISLDKLRKIKIKALEVLRVFMVYSIDEGFNCLLKYSHDNDEQVSKKAKEVAIDFLKYRLVFLKNIGFYPQIKFIQILKKLSLTKTKILNNFDLVLNILTEIIRLEFQNIEWVDYQKMSWENRSLMRSKNLENIRNECFLLLKEFYNNISEINKREMVISVMRNMTFLPISASYSDDLAEMVKKELVEILDFYIDIFPEANNKVKLEIESQCSWFNKRFKGDNIVPLKNLSELIRTDEFYKVYRTLVGYEHEFDTNKDWKETAGEREKEVNRIAQNIIDGNFDGWEKKVQEILDGIELDDLGRYSYFGKFIRYLSCNDSDIALSLLSFNGIKNFFVDLFCGLIEGNSEVALRIIKKKISKKEDLMLIACLPYFSELFPPEILIETYSASISSSDWDALRNINRSIFKRYSDERIYRELLFKSIDQLTYAGLSLGRMEIFSAGEIFFNNLNKKEIDIILENLIESKSIDYEMEGVINSILEKYPRTILKFFEHRIYKAISKDLINANDKKKVTNEYDPVPFALYRRSEAWTKYVEIIIPIIFKISLRKNWRYQYEAAQLIKVAYPQFDPILEKFLIDKVHEKNENNVRNIIQILERYEGENFLIPVVKSIAEIPEFKGFWFDLFFVLSGTGVVTGEFGFVNAYKNKKREIKMIIKDSNSNLVKEFMLSYNEFLNTRIDSERKRAEIDSVVMRQII
ncbi:hypothetical protein M0R04_01345 [Candidatus Dojkabacteria bacterium]|jgi:hypothetical protein|nr:hypothetical protein [Candidatus Dojkabacteria bacterium]